MMYFNIFILYKKKGERSCYVPISTFFTIKIKNAQGRVKQKNNKEKTLFLQKNANRVDIYT